jgi:hypothetical protein
MSLDGPREAADAFKREEGCVIAPRQQNAPAGSAARSRGWRCQWEPISVRLTDYEMELGRQVGAERFKDRAANGRDPGRGPSDLAGWQRGVQCEMAAAIGLNLYWRPGGAGFIAFREPDVGGLVEIRSIVTNWHRLFVKPWDKAEPPYVLVLQDKNDHQLIGWLAGFEVRELGEFKPGPRDPGHWVRQRQLRDIHDLKRRLHHDLTLRECERVERLAAVQPEERV